MKEIVRPIERILSALRASARANDSVQIKGVYTFELFDARGNVINRGKFKNVLTTVGKNEILNDSLHASTNTLVGPYCGIISSTSYTTPVVGDTMASHAGWLEAGTTNAPTYGSTRPTAAFAAASGGVIAYSSAVSFTFTGSGTVSGTFTVIGSGASATVMSTTGTLLSAGGFGTAQPVISGNVMTVSYTLTLS